MKLYVQNKPSSFLARQREEAKSRIMYRWLTIVALSSVLGFYGAHIAAYYLYFNN